MNQKSRKLEQTYYSPIPTQLITVFEYEKELDKDGKTLVFKRNPDGKRVRKIKTNPANGLPIYILNQPEFLYKIVQFTPMQLRAGEVPCSVYQVYDDTPEEIKLALEDLVKDPSNDIMYEDAWQKARNPEHFDEMQRRKALEKEVEELRKQAIDSQKAIEQAQVLEKKSDEDKRTIDDLKKKVAELEKKAKDR